MTQRFELHPTHPQRRLIQQAQAVLKAGGLIVLPTDACPVLACGLGHKEAVDRLRALRGLDDRHLLTLLCRDLAEVGTYAQIDNRQYRFLREWTPGAYTFILPATREVPRRLWHPSRKTVGLRVPDHPVAQALLEAHGEPMIGSSLILAGEDEPLIEAEEIMRRLAGRIELLLDADSAGTQSTTVVDMTTQTPQVVREGRGPIDRMT